MKRFLKAAKNASGFTFPEVAAVLGTCNFIFTSNDEMFPVISAMFPHARVIRLAQDMNDAQITEVLKAAGWMADEDELQVVSVLQLFTDHVQSAEADERIKLPYMAYMAALQKLVDAGKESVRD